MIKDIELKAPVEFGFLPTHAGFINCLVPDENGTIPRSSSGEFVVVEEIRKVMDLSRVKVAAVQIPTFPGGKDDEWDQLLSTLQGMNLNVHMVFMLGGLDPLDPADETACVEQLKPALATAIRNGVTHVSSTSIEQWMRPGAERRNGAEFLAAVEQNAKLHERIFQEANLAGSCIEHWDIEFLRPGEFQTFTDVGRLWEVIQAMNKRVGSGFFRCLVDAAHCGDSPLSMQENIDLIEEIAKGGGLGVFHASAKTTRGCLSTDDGWISALLSAAASTGELKQVFVELFNHEDPALEPLRGLDPGHGVNTLDGREYAEAVADGIELVARQLNNFIARGIISHK